MASRIVDGNGVYKSDKLKKVPKEYRAEFANLIPLAEANGAFECNPELVWSIVYAYNRNDVTPDIVADILDSFEKAEMLVRYEANGKKYGYWVNIDKPGRLPAPSVLKKYNTQGLPPAPPKTVHQIVKKEVAAKEQEVTPEPTFSAINIPLDSHIVNQCQDVIGNAEDKRFYQKELKAAIKQYGHDEVLESFNNWIESVGSTFTGRKPINAFIKSLSGASEAKAIVSSPHLQDVETEIASITDNKVFFFTNQKPILAALIKKYGTEDVIDAFEEFWNNTDVDVSFAAKNFIEQANIRIESTHKRKAEEAAKANKVEASIMAARSQVENELEDQEEIEDEL